MCKPVARENLNHCATTIQLDIVLGMWYGDGLQVRLRSLTLTHWPELVQWCSPRQTNRTRELGYPASLFTFTIHSVV